MSGSRKPGHYIAFTPREDEVAALVARGFSNEDICRKLGMRNGTVKVHMVHIMNKLGVSSRTQAALLLVGKPIG